MRDARCSPSDEPRQLVREFSDMSPAISPGARRGSITSPEARRQASYGPKGFPGFLMTFGDLPPRTAPWRKRRNGGPVARYTSTPVRTSSLFCRSVHPDLTFYMRTWSRTAQAAWYQLPQIPVPQFMRRDIKSAVGKLHAPDVPTTLLAACLAFHHGRRNGSLQNRAGCHPGPDNGLGLITAQVHAQDTAMGTSRPGRDHATCATVRGLSPPAILASKPKTPQFTLLPGRKANSEQTGHPTRVVT